MARPQFKPIRQSSFEATPTLASVHPLTPPDTDADSPGPRPNVAATIHLNNSNGVDDGAHHVDPFGLGHPADPFSRHRKGSVLGYTSQYNPREVRGAPSRSSKWLVIVVPPSVLTQEPPMLGHTLSTAPSGRFNNGILMPLFPTMYGQLTAIAKEFGLPSTVGLCLYMHFSDNGAKMTPRVSDESWPYLWGPFFEDQTTTGHSRLKTPISGTIEFDVDLRKAKWFDAWMGHPNSFGEHMSVAPTHRRMDSRATSFQFEADAVSEIAQSESGLLPLQLASSTRTAIPSRLAPLRLSLLERRAADTGSSIRPRSRLDAEEDDHHYEAGRRQTAVATILSPVPQEEEPKTAKQLDLDTRVRQWRATNVPEAAVALKGTGQPSLDPANLPNFMPHLDASAPKVVHSEAAEDAEELDPNDFTWSISSAGPASGTLESFHWEEDDSPSVHLVERLQGSVCLTPTTVSSFGPMDWDRSEFEMQDMSIRVASPDIAQRGWDDVPCTPTTATSWGPASPPQSPLSVSQSLTYSVDLADRAQFTRPVTPYTATSWGPGSWPPSPPIIQRPPSVDLGHRAGWGAPPVMSRQNRDSHISQTVRSATAWQQVWPFNAVTRDDSMGSPLNSAPVTAAPWQQVWPFNTASQDDSASSPLYSTPATAAQWAHVWPYQGSLMTGESALGANSEAKLGTKVSGTPHEQLSFRLGPVSKHVSGTMYPIIQPYSNVYPNLDVYPAVSDSFYPDQDAALASRYPIVQPYLAVYPHLCVYPEVQDDSLDAGSRHSTMSISSTVYPHSLSEIYSGAGQTWFFDQSPTTASPTYPNLVIYPKIEIAAAYPQSLSEIYPGAGGIVYPMMAANLTDYPWSMSEIYTGAGETWYYDQTPVATTMIYPTIVVYPQIDIASQGYPQSLVEIYPGAGETWYFDQSPVNSTSAYPTIVLYPRIDTTTGVYPESLAEIYPGAGRTWYFDQSPVNSTSLYPTIVLYPRIDNATGVYPGSLAEIYPGAGKTWYFDQSPVNSTAVYPTIVLYPRIDNATGVYPESLAEIYLGAGETWYFNQSPLNMTLVYPTIVLYPQIDVPVAVYPSALSQIYPGAGETWYFDQCPVTAHLLYPNLMIYPGNRVSYSELELKPVNIDLGHSYPSLQIYLPVYPHFDLYPRHVEEEMDPFLLASCYPLSSVLGQDPVQAILPLSYPTIEIYARGYPWSLDAVYPAKLPIEQQEEVDVTLPLEYPEVAPYRPGYPHLCIYSGVDATESLANVLVIEHAREATLIRDYTYPGIVVYPSVYPQMEIYSRRLETIITRASLAPSPKASVHSYSQASIDHSLSRVGAGTERVQRGVPGSSRPSPLVARARRHKTHQELHDLIFRGRECSPSQRRSFQAVPLSSEGAWIEAV